MGSFRLQESRGENGAGWTRGRRLHPGESLNFFTDPRTMHGVRVHDRELDISTQGSVSRIINGSLELPLGSDGARRRIVYDDRARTPKPVDPSKVRSAATEATDSKDFAGQKVTVRTHHGMENMGNDRWS